jgi:hypothetical protein
MPIAARKDQKTLMSTELGRNQRESSRTSGPMAYKSCTINVMGFVRQIRQATGPSPRSNPTLQNLTQIQKISRHFTDTMVSFVHFHTRPEQRRHMHKSAQ